MKKIGILVAMDSEFRLVRESLAGGTESIVGPYKAIEGQYAGSQVVLVKCGVGKVNASVAATHLILSAGVDCLVSTGVAGGLDSSLSVFDIVVSSQMCYHDVWCGPGTTLGAIQGMPDRYAADNKMLESAMSLSGRFAMHKGLIVTGDRFVTSAEELSQIKGSFKEALAVDMESCAIAQVAYIHSVPFISIRVVSDTPGSDGHIQQYESFWSDVSRRSFDFLQNFLRMI